MKTRLLALCALFALALPLRAQTPPYTPPTLGLVGTFSTSTGVAGTFANVWAVRGPGLGSDAQVLVQVWATESMAHSPGGTPLANLTILAPAGSAANVAIFTPPAGVTPQQNNVRQNAYPVLLTASLSAEFVGATLTTN